MATIWRPVPINGYEECYEVSNRGEVRSRKTGHYRKLKLKHNRRSGYMYVNLYNKESSITRSVHRLVAMAFLPNPDDKPEVNHINEDKTDNRVENLEWTTSHENNVHRKYKRCKPIGMYSVDGELLATFTSERAVCEVLGTSKANVSQALGSDRRTCQGYVIKYAEEVD